MLKHAWSPVKCRVGDETMTKHVCDVAGCLVVAAAAAAKCSRQHSQLNIIRKQDCQELQKVNRPMQLQLQSLSTAPVAVGASGLRLTIKNEDSCYVQFFFICQVVNLNGQTFSRTY